MLQTINGIDLLLVLVILVLNVMLGYRKDQIADLHQEILSLQHGLAAEYFAKQECCPDPDIIELSPYHDKCHNCGTTKEYY